MLNIAIDGHAGSGKSMLAYMLAKELGVKVFDTGAIYRGLACAYKDSGMGEVTKENISNFVAQIEVKVEFIEDRQHVFVNGKDYTPWLRLEETSHMASLISPYPILREKVVRIQREFAKDYDCVMEGRDIGTEVLPFATVKFFVTAREEVRAQRRYDQIKDKGNVTYQHILENLRERDYKDEHREVAPLRPASDSIIIDTSDMTLEETIKKCIEIVEEKTENFK